MRLIKTLILAAIAIVLVVLAVANRSMVTLSLAPEGLPLPFAGTVELPLFLVILGSVLVGVLIGLLLELLRESHHRRGERRNALEAKKAQRQVDRLTEKAGETDDEILGIAH